MISLRQRILWASLMASAAFAASAQQPAPVIAAVQAQVAPAAVDAQVNKPAKAEHHKRADHKKMDPAERMARMQQRQAERQAQLKGKLSLSGTQEAAWSTYVAAIKPPLPHTGEQRPQRVDFSKLTTPERLDHLQTRQTQRQARFEQHAQATKQFYAQLTLDQQKTFDAETVKSHGGKRHGHGHRSHRGHDGHGSPAAAKS